VVTLRKTSNVAALIKNLARCNSEALLGGISA